ncbi:MAG TPA: DNA methyltransferase, partial [Phycisphaerae bacterium]|nr:DNA methyltransferase [Phycisphaerae bacterium]
LHWANKDQYYVKTTEYFTNFTFDPTRAPEVLGAKDTLFAGHDLPPLKVEFRIVAATEGEHGNVKPGADQKRFFILHGPQPVFFEDGRLVVGFEFRPDPEKTGQDRTWQEKRAAEAVEKVLAALDNLAEGKAQVEEADAPIAGRPVADLAREYAAVLRAPAPTEKQKDRPLLAKYIAQYAARNTMDYFIHKDLGGFLRRELDFYLKNEVVRLDDIEQADAPRAERYLDQVRVLRRIAHKLIAFLAQLEDFQKRLWLKKKFVVETNWCITLDRIPEQFYPEIAVNDAQREEWVRLFAINEVKKDLHSPGYAEPLTVEFLKANQFLVLDTKFFGQEFRDRLFAHFGDVDGHTGGLLVHAENLQALKLLAARYRGQVQCVHIDPPYNTATSGFLYCNSYQHSSWLAMMAERTSAAIPYLTRDGSFLCHVDENEYERLHLLLDDLALPNGGTIVWDKRNPMLGRKGVATEHEYVMWRTRVDGPVYLRNATFRLMLDTAREMISKHGGVTPQARGEFAKWVATCPGLTGGERAYRLLNDDGRVYQSVGMAAPEPRTDPKFHEPLIHPVTKKPCPVPPYGWSRSPDTLRTLIANDEIIFGKDEKAQPRRKVFLTHDSQRQVPSVIQETGRGKADVDKLGLEFPYCHPLSLYVELVGAAAPSRDSIVLDFFAGSGTSGHAVIDLNREDGTDRKHILVECGHHFDAVLIPRILKGIYAKDWKGGKPVTRNSGVSHIVKYVRLESYEDALNNLAEPAPTPEQAKVLAESPTLREDYMLHYMLDVETKGSPSLLNIDAFTDPTAYKLKVKRPGTDEYEERPVDLLETFNYLLGLRVEHLAAPQTFSAEFERPTDPELPEDQRTRLTLKGKLKQDPAGPWWFRKVEGWLPRDPHSPNNADREKVLVVWRRLTGDLEKDNLVLDAWFEANRINTRDWEFDTIYVNGSNNLPNLLKEGDTWKVR